MKTITTLCAVLVTIAYTHQSFAAGDEKRDPGTLKTAHRQDIEQPSPRAGQHDRDVSGVIPLAIRGGKPLEMLDPFAPAKYGTAEKNTDFRAAKPGDGTGVRLFSTTF